MRAVHARKESSQNVSLHTCLDENIEGVK
jgi:hypothetical protein